MSIKHPKSCITLLWLVAAACAVGCCSAAYAYSDYIIPLKHNSAGTIMMALGLYSVDDLLNGKTAPWIRDADKTFPDGRVQIPGGVGRVGPAVNDTALAVRGRSDAMATFKALVEKIDTEPKWVTLKVSRCIADRKPLVASLSLYDIPLIGGRSGGLLVFGPVSRSITERSKSVLAEKNMPGPEITCRNNSCVTQHFAIMNGEQSRLGYDYSILPRANTDGTITLYTKWSAWDRADTKNVKSSSVVAQRRIADGKNLAILFPDWWKNGGSPSLSGELIIVSASLPK